MLRIWIGMEPHYFWPPDPGVSKLGPDPNLNNRENITECGEQIVNMKINIILFGLKEGVRCECIYGPNTHSYIALVFMTSYFKTYNVGLSRFLHSLWQTRQKRQKLKNNVHFPTNLYFILKNCDLKEKKDKLSAIQQ